MAKPHTILSLDLGTDLGWCLVQGNQIMKSGTLRLTTHKVHPGLRFLRFRNWLHPFRGVTEIFFEDVPRFESAKAARVYCGLLAELQVFSALHGIRCTGIKPTSVKKEFTGNGGCKKDLICKVAHQLGWQHGHIDTDIDNDEADAIATAYVLMKRRGHDLVFKNKTP